MQNLAQLLDHKIVAILRGMPPQETLRIAGALYDGVAVLNFACNVIL